MKWLRRLFFRLIPCYRRLEIKMFTYAQADDLLDANEGKPESEQWRLAPEEDDNHPDVAGWIVLLERRERIWN